MGDTNSNYNDFIPEWMMLEIHRNSDGSFDSDDDDDFEEPIIYAARDGDLSWVQALLEEGANVNTEGCFRLTPLHEVCWEGYFEVARLLIEHGANLNAKNVHGRTPLHQACFTRQYPQDIVKLLIEKGADLDTKDNSGCTALNYAACNHHSLEISKLLVENGSNVNAKDNDGYTPMHWSCFHTSSSVLETLQLLRRRACRNHC